MIGPRSDKGNCDMTEKIYTVDGVRELPSAFVEEMKELFEKLPGVSVSELPAFLESFREERSFGLRRNPLKYEKKEFGEKMPFTLKEIPWAEEGYFFEKQERPGKSPYHEAGAFYMQEPSAMIAVELLGANPGDIIADLCAAPGGKSTQIAGKMLGEGLLLCNEYVSARAAILSQNIERMGVRNCIILSESADRIAKRLPLFFDRVLVDAPCSGEGMFRKEEQALLQWSLENVSLCAKRQKEILEEAAKIVKPGGVLVYSTCTFSEAENEWIIRDFLEAHDEFRADESVLSKDLSDAGVCPGGLPGTIRMWPHKLRGEGHFAAKLIKEGSGSQGKLTKEMKKNVFGRSADKAIKSTCQNWDFFQEFCEKYICAGCREKLKDKGRFVWRKEYLYLLPEHMPDLSGLRIERGGLCMGEAKKGRFEPSHTWAMTLHKEDVLQSIETEDPAGYLHGGTLENTGYSGWLLVLFQGKPLGWGKAGGNIVKNHYPRGLRK